MQDWQAATKNDLIMIWLSLKYYIAQNDVAWKQEKRETNNQTSKQTTQTNSCLQYCFDEQKSSIACKASLVFDKQLRAFIISAGMKQYF